MSGRGPVEEREVKLTAPHGWTLPDLAALPGVAVDDHGEHLLHAVYWDTDDLALVRSGIGLRHRNGTWALKGRTGRDGDAVVRSEHEVEGAAGAIPTEMHEALCAVVTVAALHPVVEVDTLRHTLVLRRGDDAVEVVLDVVTVLSATATVERYTAVEVEYALSETAFAAEVVTVLRAAGAAVDPTSKYLRALRAVGRDVDAATNRS